MQYPNAEQDHSEQTVRELLEQRGFTCCPEPDWITTGKKPDFFCTGPADIWVEVKSLGLTPAWKKAEAVADWFDKCRKINGPGARISVSYSSDVTEQDVKEALKRVRILLHRDERDSFDFLSVIIPHDPDYKSDIEFTICKSGKRLLILSAKSRSNRYGIPYFHWKLGIRADDDVHIREADERHVCTAGVLGFNGQEVRLACNVTPRDCLGLTDSSEVFHEILVSGLSEIAKAKLGWPDADRFLEDAKDAARKIKNALGYKPAPSIVFMFSENDSEGSCRFRVSSLKTTFYGMPTLATHGESSSVIHGQGGFWSKKKNTSVSAACYMSNGKAICLIHNPFAKYPFPKGLLGCEEYQLSESRKAQQIR